MLPRPNASHLAVGLGPSAREGVKSRRVSALTGQSSHERFRIRLLGTNDDSREVALQAGKELTSKGQFVGEQLEFAAPGSAVAFLFVLPPPGLGCHPNRGCSPSSF